MSLPNLFTDNRSYQSAFVDGLQRMLVHDDLGVFILVLANAAYDEEILSSLGRQLEERFRHFESLHREGSLQGPPDDLQVFEKMMATGFGQLQASQFRQVGPWEIQFNQMRSFRPSRISKTRVDTLQLPFNAEGFHFNKPFLMKEILWQGVLMGTEVRLLYNKFPFADYHTLLVYEPQAGLPQYLTEDVHYRIAEWCRRIGEGVSGFGIGYNAYGAAASVNHLHFQLYARQQRHYPVEDDRWQHNGGMEDYPLDCHKFDDAAAAWQFISHLHAVNKAYNLIYYPEKLYVVTRRMQGHFSLSDKLVGIGWSDVAGSLTMFTEQDFAGIDEAFVSSQFAEVALFEA